MINAIDVGTKRNKDKKDKVEILIFFLIAYGVGFTVGIANHFMGALEEFDFAVFTMILPASGAALAKMYSEGKEDENRIVHLMLTVGLVLNFAVVLLRMLDLIGTEIYNSLSMLVCTVMSLAIMTIAVTAWIKGGELNPFNEGRKSMMLIALFVLVHMISIFIMAWQEKPDYFMSVLAVCFNIPTFFLQSIYFFGEEYGWRGFLQGKLQSLFGKRRGVLMVGILWESWHIPSFWMAGGGMEWETIVLRILSTISTAVFLGYVYMKTKNVWTCALIHFLNNSIAYSLEGIPQEGTGNGVNLFTIAGAGLWAVFCIGFLFSKEYAPEKRQDE